MSVNNRVPKCIWKCEHRQTHFYQNSRQKAKQSLNSQLIDFVIEPLPTRKFLDPNAKCKAVKVVEKIQRGKGVFTGREKCVDPKKW